MRCYKSLKLEECAHSSSYSVGVKMSMESTSLVLIALATFVVGLNATTILHDSENLFRYRVQRQSSVNIDDVSCDSQLSLFSEALLAQDLWALKCESLNQ